MTNDALEHLLRSALPGRPRRAVSGPGLVDAAVLVPLLLYDEEARLLFTRRTDRVETHKGQISFPGGVVDAGDADVVATALREMREELGVESAAVEPIGLLDELATPTGFRIMPVVGILRSHPRYAPNAAEVEEVFEAPLAALRDPAICSSELLYHDGVARQVWTYAYGRHRIWGATALILKNLLSIATPGLRAGA